jgi:hypothetical protein
MWRDLRSLLSTVFSMQSGLTAISALLRPSILCRATPRSRSSPRSDWGRRSSSIASAARSGPGSLSWT